MADEDVESIHIYRRLVDRLLARAELVKPDKQIEPPLTEAHLGEAIWKVEGDDEKVANRLSQQTQFAAVEIAFRERFYSLLVSGFIIAILLVYPWSSGIANRLLTKATTSIEEPAFIQIWNLLDIISIFSDNGSFGI